MLLCPNCQESRKPTDTFCGHCGVKLSQETPQPFVTQMDMTVTDVRANLVRVYLKMKKIDQAKELIDKMMAEPVPSADAYQLSEELKQLLAGENAS